MRKKKNKAKKIRRTIVIFILLAAATAVAGVAYYRMAKCNATSIDGLTHTYYIYPNTPLDSVIHQMEADYLFTSMLNIHLYARHAKMTIAQPGYYRFESVLSSRTIVNTLKNGYQEPIPVSFGMDIRDRQQLASRLGKVLLLDSADIMKRLDSTEYLAQYDLTKETAVCLFIPDTYEMFWTITPDDLFARMYKEYKEYWTDERKHLADSLNLTPNQVYTLASIVYSETYKAKEHATIASLYLNRIRKGMPLQACPTVIFATGDYSMNRVMNHHLKINSPYNTYKNKGLPPGPIRLASAAVMDSVLHAPKTKYLYMCANPDWTFTHVFSTTYAQHQRVAAAYRRELNKRGIK